MSFIRVSVSINFVVSFLLSFFVRFKQVFVVVSDAETVTLILRQTDSLKFLCHFLLTHMRQKAADSAKKSNSAEGQTNLRTLTNGSRQSGDDKEGGSEVDSVVFFVISVLQRAAETEVSHVESWALV